MEFEQDSWIWITDEVDRYLPVKVLVSFKRGNPTTVLLENNEERYLTEEETSTVQECHVEALDPKIDDLINISDLNEMSILHNLRMRYRGDVIYTNISSILISVNPFKQLPLYGPSLLAMYRDGIRGKDPHIFAVAYNAYHNLMSKAGDQSVVCSGESGAGKSEATKLILQFLADVSSRSVAKGSTAASEAKGRSLESQVLAANPILEAFGNAKTLRNNNSSRFGKLITINFDQYGSIIGGGIINYLLEKSRVVGQTAGERNYHIFYQLLSSVKTESPLAKELQLQPAEYFNYTAKSQSTIEGVSDEEEFEEVQRSMDILHFSAEEKTEVFKVVAGVLHLGNLKFEGKHVANEDERAFVANGDVVALASSLWGIDAAALETALISRNMATRDSISVRYNVSQAQDARDAMTKRVYAELFQLVVDKINLELGGSKLARQRFIGVLDIFGFESFEVNSFEQLCINYCNEKLQFHFNEHIFRMEQSLYAAEGITIAGIKFVDNQPTLDLLEAKAVGIFSMIDEEISVPKGSDEGFLQKVFSRHVVEGKHPNCLRPKGKDCKDTSRNFGILHYAGPVFYNITSFLEKNKDQLHVDILSVLRTSSSPLLKRMFPAPVEETSGRNGRAGGGALKTLGAQFKQQLNDLIVTLNETFPHFVRCMKPNDFKQADSFDASRMQDQLRYAGLLEVCRIRKLGYPVRRPFQEFFRRYRCCVVGCDTLDDVLAALSKKGVLITNEWAKGLSRVFMRNEQSAKLEIYREEQLLVYAVRLQTAIRGMVARHRLARCLVLIGDLKQSISRREDSDLDYYLGVCPILPWKGEYLPIVKDARVLLQRILEEKSATKELKRAIESKQLAALRNAVSIAVEMSPPLQSQLVSDAQSLIARLEAELAAQQQLRDAISSKDISLLGAAVANADGISYVCSEVGVAVALKSQLEAEKAATDSLRDAIHRRSIDDIDTGIRRCLDLALPSIPEIALARETKEKILLEQKQALVRAAVDSLQSALQASDVEMLRAALAVAADTSKTTSIEVDALLVTKAKEQIIRIEADSTRAALLAALAARDLTALTDAIAAAEKLEFKGDELQQAIVLKVELDKLRIKDRLKARILGNRAGKTSPRKS